MYFNPAQLSMASSAFQRAEKLAGQHFHLNREEIKKHRYDVKTLAYLDSHEVKQEAFAHLCKYHYSRDEDANLFGSYHFYRICLQDNRILNAVERGHSFIKISPLILYIATHELVHIIRFEAGEIDFDASREEKEKEEDRVHAITSVILQACISPEIKLVLDCFSNQYRIGDIFN